MQAQIPVVNAKYLLRPIQAQDSDAIHALHERASTRTLYYRFMRNYQPNYSDAQNIVATGKGLVLISKADEIIGYAYYVAEETKPFVAEFAALLEDKVQGQGLGRYLLKQFCQYALIQGIDTLKGSIHSSNNAMKILIHKLGYPIDSSWDYGEYSVALDLKAKIQDKMLMPERG